MIIKKFKLISILLIIMGCSNKAQKPIIVNIKSDFPSQYFPNYQINNGNIDDDFIQDIDINQKEINHDIEKNITQQSNAQNHKGDKNE